MNAETIRDYCVAKQQVTEGFPFDETTLVFKVANKMFALMSLDGQLQINLKCDPDRAMQLREQYPAIIPGYHMDKKHWNSVIIDGTIPVKLLRQLIDDSYSLIVSKLSKAIQKTLE